MTKELENIVEGVFNRIPECPTKLFDCLNAVEKEIGGYKNLDEFQSVYFTLWQSLDVQGEWVYDKYTREVSVQITEIEPPCKKHDAVYKIGGAR